MKVFFLNKFLFIFYFEGDAWDFFIDKNTIPKEGLPLFTVLTLSATASEFDTGGVISNPVGKLKLGCFFNFPVASAIDPTIQFSLPWRQIMCGAVDSLSHLMESFFSLPNKSLTTREVNLALQRSILKFVILLML
jgi:alcohol dehydrogenase YqhD (iron-dependent ADH family)